MSDPTFAIIGAAGYIAERHLDAIHHVGGRVLGACDKKGCDAVGILDKYDDLPAFFDEIERFDRWLDRQNRGPQPVDYVVVCSPNYLHEPHARLAMRAGSNVIVEKPACLTERNLDALMEIESETGQSVKCILQLRNTTVPTLKRDGTDSILVAYSVKRGVWYDYSWKGDTQKSGGVLTNIGIHLIDLLCFSFALGLEKPRFNTLLKKGRAVLGDLHLGEGVRASVDLRVRYQGPVQRALFVNEEKIDLSASMGFHNLEYEALVAGDGWNLETARDAIRICEEAR